MRRIEPGLNWRALARVAFSSGHGMRDAEGSLYLLPVDPDANGAGAAYLNDPGAFVTDRLKPPTGDSSTR